MAPLETPGDENWARGFHLQGGDNSILSLLIDENDTLYAGGGFCTIDLILANGLASWDGLQWSAFGTGFTAGIITALSRIAVATCMPAALSTRQTGRAPATSPAGMAQPGKRWEMG